MLEKEDSREVLISSLKIELSKAKEENIKLRETIKFIAKEILRERDKLIESMNYILILDRNDFESKG